ncbi:MAG TPA: type II secretion system protein [Tepidisphaeraceae bacterium]|nr:type II secretion system protein [Tepidisphaeraceae bacterium]
MGSHPRRGFSLLEVLIVVAILAVIAAFLLPAVQHARQLAVQVQCASRLRAIGHAFILYASDNDGHMVTTSGSDISSYNWVFWKPEQGDIEKSPLVPYLGLHGQELRNAFRCPAQPSENQLGYQGSRPYPYTFSMNAFLAFYKGMTYPAVKHPARKILVYDENERSDDDIFWYATDRDTLAGRHGSRSTQTVVLVGGDPKMQITRGMGNVLFFDAHVELADNNMCHDPRLNDPSLP